MWSIALLLFLHAVAADESGIVGDDWRAEAEQRIRDIRMADIVVRVRDSEGNPVSGESVHVAMTRHAFPWGTCVTAGRIMGDGGDNETYRAKLLELFNCVVFENDLKWNAWHGAYGPSFSPEQTLAAAQWLVERDYYIRGHYMIIPSWEYLEPWGKSLGDDLPDLRRRILEHIDMMAAFTREFADEWDVVNEPVNNNEVLKVLGDEVMVEWYHRARATLPESCRLFINEFNIVEPFSFRERDAYEAVIRALLDAGAPLEGIGFQSHFQSPPKSPVEALQVFDRFARFGLPIVVTEFDVNTTHEDRQAQFTRDFLTAAFSHPSCAGFVFWGFWENSHWRPDSAMFRADWSEKPNFHAYRDLVFKEWWTDETGITCANGELALRVFKGTYRITVGDLEKTVAVGGDSTVIDLTP